MTEPKLGHDATASTRGIIYQLCVAVKKCYEMTSGQKVIIERLGDVTIEDEQQIEVKNYKNALTDSHPNLWKTLFNWMSDGFTPTQYKALILYTTQEFGSTATISGLNNAILEEQINILEQIWLNNEESHRKKLKESEKDEVKASDTLKLQRFVLAAENREKLQEVLSRFYIEAACPKLDSLFKQIKEERIKGVLQDKRNDFLNSLIGFICQLDKPEETSWEITYEDFDAKIGDLNAMYSVGTKEFPKKYLYSKEEIDTHQEHKFQSYRFVRKILDIQYPEAINEAIKNYLSTQITIETELREYAVPGERTERYKDGLIKIFNGEYRIARRICTLSTVIRDSKNLYDKFTISKSHDFEGFNQPPREFRNGVLHMEMDVPERELKWRLEPDE